MLHSAARGKVERRIVEESLEAALQFCLIQSRHPREFGNGWNWRELLHPSCVRPIQTLEAARGVVFRRTSRAVSRVRR